MKRALQLLNISFWCTVALMLTVGNASAGLLECPPSGSPDTLMSVDSADACAYGSGNGPNNEAEAAAEWGGVAADWDKWELVGADDFSGSLTVGMLTIDVENGAWGSFPVDGTWTLGAGFWDSYSTGILKAHIGNGGGEPDWWGFTLTPGLYTGDWDLYDNPAVSGGLSGRGLSNFFLFGKEGGGTSVPEPGILSLLGFALLGLGLSRRRQQKV